jgi:hypothetical protein
MTTTWWEITGADARTGQDRTITVEAESQDDAESQANDLGLLVSAIERVAAPLRSPESAAGAAVARAQRQVEVSYALPQARPLLIDRIFNLRVVGVLLAGLTLLAYMNVIIHLVIWVRFLALGSLGGFWDSLNLAQQTINSPAGSALVFAIAIHFCAAGCFTLDRIVRSHFARRAQSK